MKAHNCYCPACITHIGRILELEAENAALREDKARLDWLSSEHGPIFHMSSGVWMWRYIEEYDAFGGAYDTLRAAIDAAMKPK